MHSTLQPTGMPLARPRSRTGLVACVVLVAAVTFLSLYLSAAIFLSVALTSLINLIGLAAAIALWTLPRKWLRITAMVVRKTFNLKLRTANPLINESEKRQFCQ